LSNDQLRTIEDPNLTDFRKRTTLKTMSVATATVATGAIVALAAIDEPVQNLGITVTYAPSRDFDTVELSNPSDQDVSISLEFSGDVEIPGGRLDVKKLMANGPIKLDAQSSRSYRLPKLESRIGSSLVANIDSHSALRFPVSDNVVIDHVKVLGGDAVLHNSAPIYLNKA